MQRHWSRLVPERIVGMSEKKMAQKGEEGHGNTHTTTVTHAHTQLSLCLKVHWWAEIATRMANWKSQLGVTILDTPLYIHYNSHHQLRQRVHIKQETNKTESAANKETPLFKIPWLTSGCLVPRFNLCTSFQAFCTMHTSQTGAGLTENRQGNAGP